MKTPKEILFARHRPAEAKLDVIRKEVVAAVGDGRAPKPSADMNQPVGVVIFLRDLFRWKPQAWAAFAGIWILIFALKLSTRDGAQVVAQKSSVSQEVIAELREQRLFFAELIGTRDARDAEPPKSNTTRPRSELRYETTLV